MQKKHTKSKLSLVTEVNEPKTSSLVKPKKGKLLHSETPKFVIIIT